MALALSYLPWWKPRSAPFPQLGDVCVLSSFRTQPSWPSVFSNILAHRRPVVEHTDGLELQLAFAVVASTKINKFNILYDRPTIP